MVSNLPLMALKFKDFSYRNNAGRFILIALSAAIVIVLAVTKNLWLAWPVIFVLYVLLSLFYKDPVAVKTSNQQTLDVTV
jgi:CDP-diacylglycerol--serine O-phosphatidyltransferase